MSSNYIKLQNKSISFRRTKVKTKFLENITKLKKSLTTFLDTLKKVVNAISPFLALFQNDPFTTLYKALVKTISDFMDSLLASGVSVILITPFNQAQGKTINLDFNLLNPINELEETVEAIKQTDINYANKKEIENLEKKLAVTTDETQKIKIREEIKELSDSITEYNYEKEYLFTVEESLPKLSASDAIEELILSFDNKSDKFRPKWNDLNTVTGWGLILSATTQIELLNNISSLNILFNFTELSKGYEKFRANVDSWSKTMNKKAEDSSTLISENKVIEDFNKLNELVIENEDGTTVFNSKERKKALIKANLDKYLESIYGAEAFTNLLGTTGNAPKWMPFTLEVIPYLRDFKNVIIDSLNVILLGTEAMDTVGKSILTAFTQKINSLISIVESVNEMLTFLESLKFGLSGTVFTINDLNESDPMKGGGVSFMKEQLEILKSFPTDLLDLSNKTQTQREDMLEEMERIKQSEFSILVYMALGYTDFNKVKEQFKKLQNLLALFNLTINEDEGKIEEEEETLDNQLNSLSFEVFPENLTSYDSLVTVTTFPITVIFNSQCKKFSYSLTSSGYSSFKDVVKNDILISNNSAIFTLKNLEDANSYELLISAYGDEGSSSLVKIYRFSTNFSLNAIDVNSEGSLINNPSTTTYDGSLYTPDGLEIPFISSPNSSLELVALSGEGEYQVAIFSDASKKQYVSKQFKDCGEKIEFRRQFVIDGVFYVKEFPYNLYLLEKYGEYAQVTFSDRTEIFKLPSCIHVDEETIYLSFLNGSDWTTPLKITSRLSTNVSDFCLTLT